MALAAAAACGQTHGPSPLPDYARDLASLAGLPAAPDSLFVPPAYPDAADRRLRGADVRIGVGRFLDLKICGLRHLVAERNSALGRMESDGLRLVYEQALLSGLARCLEGLEASADDPLLAAALRDALEAKLATAGATLWNATLGSSELAGAYRVSGPALDPTRSDPEPVSALRGLAAAAREFGRPGAVLERGAHLDNLGVLERSGYGGRLAKAMGRATENLRAATRHLRGLSCEASPEHGVKAARQRFERGDVGRWLDGLVEAARTWHAALNELLSAQTASPPPAFLRYHAQVMDMNNPQGLGPALLSAIEDHRVAWRHVAGCVAPDG
jgi:hypothetical protein